MAGEVEVGGERVEIRSPREAIAAGLALVPEDRKRQGAILDMAVLENASLASLERDKRAGAFLNREAERAIAAQGIEDLSIRTPGDWQAVRYLSGGNQQKVVLAKWLAMEPAVLLLDEPTRGIDVGAKYEIYLLINKPVEQGKAIILISSELPEVLGMSDRILVMHEGKIRGEITDVANATQHDVLSLAIHS